MLDTSRIEPILAKMKELNIMCTQCQIPLTMEEKQKLLEDHAKIWNTIMHSMTVQRICANCEHCVLWEGKHCCAARDMAPIPFEVVNRVGGCSKWYEKDFVPFAFAFLTIGGTIAESMFQMWQNTGLVGVL